MTRNARFTMVLTLCGVVALLAMTQVARADGGDRCVDSLHALRQDVSAAIEDARALLPVVEKHSQANAAVLTGEVKAMDYRMEAALATDAAERQDYLDRYEEVVEYLDKLELEALDPGYENDWNRLAKVRNDLHARFDKYFAVCVEPIEKD